jgi:hypothetical protein
MFERERLERLLREPNNLFGPPTGTGYDYGRAAMVLAAVAATAVSTAALLFALENPVMTTMQAVVLMISIPNLIGFPFLWPLNLMLGLVTSFLLWLGTIYVFAWWRGWRKASLATRWCSTLAVVAGWISGAAVYIWLLVRWNA